MKATATLYLDPRPNKNGYCPVKIRITYNSQRKYYSTDVYLYHPEKSEPDPLTALLTAKRRSPEEKETHRKLLHYLNKAEDAINTLKVFTFDKFNEAFTENRNLRNSVSYAFDKKIKLLKLNDQIGSAVNYQCAKNSIEDFKKGLTFADVTPELLKQYEKWMLSNGRSITTVGIYLRCLRALFNAQKIDKLLYPFGIGLYEIPTSRNIKKALTIEEISLIYYYKTEPMSYEDMAKDYWIFLYLCNGMNVKDLCQLKWSNIDGTQLNYERAKTKNSRQQRQMITVALKPEALEVIKKWGRLSVNQDAFIFSHLDKEMTAERQRAVHQQLTQLINKHMKRIARNVGITEPVTTYSARHSFATILKRSGTNIAMISDLLGHSSIEVTKNYLASFEFEQIEKETEALTSFRQAK